MFTQNYCYVLLSAHPELLNCAPSGTSNILHSTVGVLPLVERCRFIAYERRKPKGLQQSAPLPHPPRWLGKFPGKIPGVPALDDNNMIHKSTVIRMKTLRPSPTRREKFRKVSRSFSRVREWKKRGFSHTHFSKRETFRSTRGSTAGEGEGACPRRRRRRRTSSRSREVEEK